MYILKESKIFLVSVKYNNIYLFSFFYDMFWSTDCHQAISTTQNKVQHSANNIFVLNMVPHTTYKICLKLCNWHVACDVSALRVAVYTVGC
jgi:hypothetical protein